MIASWPRMLLEVFVRKNFGERYFSLATAITLAILLTFVPFIISKNYFTYGSQTFFEYVWSHPTWYLYIIAFLYFTRLRYLEVKREPGVYDLEKFSLSTGEKLAKFYEIDLFNIKTTSRVIATIYEPAFFLVIGIFLSLCNQPIGYLIVYCSICYSLGYAGQYYLGDMFIMDTIDNMICNEELVESFVNNRQPHETKGFEAYGQRPSNEEFRRKVYDNFFEDQREASEVF